MPYLVQQTALFVQWHASVQDLKASVAIARRIERLAAGGFGDVRHVGSKVSELRIDVGPGYRVYFTIRRKTVVILLAGGDKHTQAADIRRAHRLAREVASHG